MNYQQVYMVYENRGQVQSLIYGLGQKIIRLRDGTNIRVNKSVKNYIDSNTQANLLFSQQLQPANPSQSFPNRLLRMNPVVQTNVFNAKAQYQNACNPFQQKYHFEAIEPSRTVRPYKNVHHNKPFTKVNSLFSEQAKPQEKTIERRKSNQQSTNHSQQISQNFISSANNSNHKIPSTDQSDILWKTQISQSFIQKLEEFQSSSQLQPNHNNQKKHNNKKMEILQKQVRRLRLYSKEMSQKVVQMHKVYSEGNKKSIELVMLIVKQLQKQNQSLKQKISSMNLLAMSQSIRSNHKNNDQSQKQPLHKDIPQSKIIPFYKTNKCIENKSPDLYTSKNQHRNNQMESSRIQNVQREEVNQTQTSEASSNDLPVQGSPVWSVLLTDDHRLQTIQELQHDDDSYSINEKNETCALNHTFTSKLGGSGRLSDFNDQNISHFHVETIEKTVIEKKDQQNKQIQEKNEKNPNQQQSQDQAVLTLKTHETSFNEQIQDDDEEQSLIVKKLLKLNKIQRKNHSSQKVSLPQIQQMTSNDLTPQTSINKSLKQKTTQVSKSHDPFSGISLSHLSTENYNSISQALSILKEYSSHEGLNISVLNESQENTKKTVKPKCPPKISLVACKKVKNKENLPF